MSERDNWSPARCDAYDRRCAAQEAACAVNDEITRLRQQMDDQHRLRSDAVIGELFSDRYRAATKERVEAERALDTLLSDEAKVLKEWAGLPVGTRFVHWSYKRWFPEGRKWEPSGKPDAILEIVTNESASPGSRRSGFMSYEYGRPVLRILKKDGTPSANFARYERYSDYKRAGINPNTTEDHYNPDKENPLLKATLESA